MKTPRQVLKEFWGHDDFRENQLQAIDAVLSKQDALVLMPTGGGKSICYQIPALLNEGICIVISPLVALMEDQVEQLKNKEIKAMTLPGGTSFAALDILLNNCMYGGYKFLYISPERLQQDIVKERIQKMNVSLFAIDEAHCISQWGHDFRPSYLALSILKELRPNVPTMAVTATATELVQSDIIKHLNFEKYKIFKSSYKRDNLSYGVYKTQDKNYLLYQIVSKQKGATIVYVPTRNATITVSDFLKDKNITSVPYHGGLDLKTKQSHFKQWKNNKAQVIVATNAFGMGIDKSDVRTVIHIHIPQSIESYFQEAGRAGRDGQRAYTLLLQTENTIEKLKSQYDSQTPDLAFIKKIYRKLSSYLQISYGEGENNSYHLIFSEFCERYQFSKIKTYAGLKILDKNGILQFTEVFSQQTKIQVIISINRLNQFIEKTPIYEPVLGALCRMYPGIFTDFTSIDLGLVAQKLNISQQQTTDQLQKLAEQEIIIFDNITCDSAITYLQPREDDLAINRVSKYIKKHLKNRLQKLKDVVNFVENNSDCKSKQLLHYFGENTGDCGICSVCIKKIKQSNNADGKIRESILEGLKENPKDSRAIMENFAYAEEDLIRTLRNLLNEGKIVLLPNNTYKLVV